jgi:hypothetical protein
MFAQTKKKVRASLQMFGQTKKVRASLQMFGQTKKVRTSRQLFVQSKRFELYGGLYCSFCQSMFGLQDITQKF